MIHQDKFKVLIIDLKEFIRYIFSMENLIAKSIPYFFALMFLEIIFSIIKKHENYEIKDSFSNLGTGIISLFSGALSKLLQILAYAYTIQNININLYLNLNLWEVNLATPKGIWSWVFAFFFFDFIYYLFHRYSHKVNFLWSAHIVHHSSERYNLSVALRQSMLQGFYSIPFYLFGAFLGIPLSIFITSRAIITIYQFWIHTREIKKLGILELFLNTPSHHRVHHSRQQKYMDKNHAGVFILWDKLFGTYMEEKDEPIYGIYPRQQTLNPLLANINPLKDLIGYFFKTNGLKNKLKVFFGSPLFIYNEFKINEKKVKIHHNKIVDMKSVLTFIIALIFSLVAIFMQNKLNKTYIIIIMIVSTLLLFLNGKQNDKLEKVHNE